MGLTVESVLDTSSYPTGHKVSEEEMAMLNIQLREQDTAIRQLEALGHKASDVRHIVLTHLDFDHAGGLEDFPNATVHVMDAEFVAATGYARKYAIRLLATPPLPPPPAP